MTWGKFLLVIGTLTACRSGARTPAASPAERGKAALAAGDKLLIEDGSDAAVRRSLGEFARAADAFRAAGATIDQGDAIFHASQAIHVLGDERMSLALAIEARALYQRGGDHVKESDALDAQATSESWLGRQDEAYAHTRTALALSRAAHDRFGIAERLLSIGFISLEVDRWPEGRRALEEAAAIYHELGKTRSEAVALSNLGYLYFLQGDAERSIDAQERALAIGRAQDDVVQIGKSELNLAGVHFALTGEAKRGLAEAEDALALWQAKDRKRDVPKALTVVAHARAATGDVDGAIAALRDAVARYRGLQSPRELASAEVELGVVLAGRGDAAGARASFDEAIASLDALHAMVHAARGRVERARLERAHGEREPARVDLERAIETFEAQRAGVAQDELRASYFATVRGAYEQLADLRAEAGDARGSFDVSERARARVLYDALRLAGADGAPRAPAAPVDDDPRALLDPDTALVEYLIAPGRSWAWIVTDRDLTVVPLAGAAPIDAAAIRLRAALTARNQIVDGERLAARRARIAAADADVAPAARALAALIVAPVLARGDRHRLVIAADGSLHEVPFALLPAGGTRLGASREIVAAPSAAVLAELRRRGRTRAAAATIAVLADPIYDAGDPRLSGAAPTAPPKPPDVIVLRGGDDAPLARLPFTGGEAQAIAALVPDRALILTGAAADRDALARPDVQAAGIVHLATHAIVDGAHLERTGLALSAFDAHGAPRDGFVRIPDIEALHLAADLVVLSACDTALGKPFRGEGLIGLVSAFHRAGVPRVVATLWQVDDEATAGLMSAFYRHLLVESEPPAAALAAAQADLAADPRFTAPYFWAGVTLHGDWR